MARKRTLGRDGSAGSGEEVARKRAITAKRRGIWRAYDQGKRSGARIGGDAKG
jgi:hypothetical protein